MITDLDLALACKYTYSGAAQTWGTDVTHVYCILTPGRCIIAFEGTSTPLEWIVDFEAIPVEERTFNLADIGIVHLGWWKDAQSVAQQIIDFLKALPPETEKACTGHSKGASECLYLAALAKSAGIVWSRVSTFGTPHLGSLNGLMGNDLGFDYQFGDDNGSDPITYEPFWLERPRPITRVTAPEMFNTPDWGPARYHHIENYIAAMKVLESQPK